MRTICRRCGESDKRGSASERRRRRRRLLQGENGIGGNGHLTACVWCGCLLGDHAGGLEVRKPTMTVRGVYLPVERLEVDRLERGGPYAFWNVVAACGDCNRSRDPDDTCPPLLNFGPFNAAC